MREGEWRDQTLRTILHTMTLCLENSFTESDIQFVSKKLITLRALTVCPVDKDKNSNIAGRLPE